MSNYTTCLSVSASHIFSAAEIEDTFSKLFKCYIDLKIQSGRCIRGVLKLSQELFFFTSLERGSSSQNKTKQKSLIKQWAIKLNPCLCISPPHSQRRLGGQVRRDRRLPEGGGRRNHDKAEVSLRDLVRSLLPEADPRLQREEPLVPRILAASLPVQTEGTPAGEQRLQPHVHLLVPPMLRSTQRQVKMGC